MLTTMPTQAMSASLWGTRRPPGTARTVTSPCGSSFFTRSTSIFAGSGTPTVTSTSMRPPLARTSVKVNGKAGKLTDINTGKRVILYWMPDEADKTARFARTIDVTFSDEELDERYPDQAE